jgi:chorismate synthase
MEWQLTEEEKTKLTKEQLNKYNIACYYMKMNNAGGMFGGWSNGVDILVSLGWTKESTTIGHRSFLKLTKPPHFSENL